MQGVFDQLRRAISDPRLGPYRQQNIGGADLDCYACYAWNNILCESLYPALQGLEVTLRNSIHAAASSVFSNDYWFNSVLIQQEQRRLVEVTARLKSLGKPSAASADDFVSGFNFGFWVSLFDSRYEQILWPRLLKGVFPHIPRRLRTRQNLLQRLDPIRILRNRVFHYEPIWHWKDLPQKHDTILEIIGWVNPIMLDMVNLFDRFAEVHRDGRQDCERALSQLMKGWKARTC